MVQQLVVGLIVLVAAFYSLWTLMPGAARRKAAARLASLARRCGVGQQGSERLQAKLAAHGSCSDCDSCKGCATPPRPGAAIVAMPRPRGTGRNSRPGSN